MVAFKRIAAQRQVDDPGPLIRAGRPGFVLSAARVERPQLPRWARIEMQHREPRCTHRRRLAPRSCRVGPALGSRDCCPEHRQPRRSLRSAVPGYAHSDCVSHPAITAVFGSTRGAGFRPLCQRCRTFGSHQVRRKMSVDRRGMVAINHARATQPYGMNLGLLDGHLRRACVYLLAGAKALSSAANSARRLVRPAGT